MYHSLSANWLRWDYRSHWQLQWLVYDKKELARLNKFDALMIFQVVVRRILQSVRLLKSPTSLVTEIYEDFSFDWLRWECRSHGQLRCLVCEEKKSTIKVNWCVNYNSKDISFWDRAYAAIRMTIEVTYKLSHGHIRRLLSRLAKMGVLVTRTFSLPCMWWKKSTIKVNWCVNYNSKVISCWERAYAAIRQTIKVTYKLSHWDIRRLLVRLAKMGV